MDSYNPFKDIQGKVFDMEHHPISNIYVDMELLQDLRFGTLLSMLTVKDEITYIYSKLKNYNERVDNEISKYFPILNISEEDILKTMADPKEILKICTIAPFTMAYDIFISFLIAIVRHNKIVSNVNHVTLNINIGDINYPMELLNKFRDNLIRLIPSLRIAISKTKRYDVNVQEFITNDAFFLFEMHKLLSEKSQTAIAFIQNGSFFGKQVFAPIYIDSTLHKKVEDYQNILVSTEYGLNIYCEFKYIPMSLVLEENYNG